jgi:hypothetical protein
VGESSGVGKKAVPSAEEPVWLVRVVLVLFLVGFAAFLAREVQRFLSWL